MDTKKGEDMKTYTITWDEKRFRNEYGFYTEIQCNSRQEARRIYLAERNWRIEHSFPHMFHVTIGLNLDISERRHKEFPSIKSAERR